MLIQIPKNVENLSLPDPSLVNFYKEIDRLVNSKVWSYMKAPWQESLELSATYVWE